MYCAVGVPALTRRARTRNISDSRLKRLYLQLNKEWFGNKLPDDLVIRWARLDKKTQAEATSPKLIRLAFS